MQTILNFLYSPFFEGIATLATGLIAIFVYLSQKKSEKINAAVSIIFEIRNAESKVNIISEKINSSSMNDLPPVLPVNNWKKYSHLFAKDFDEDEFRMINTFYNSCEQIEDLVTRQNNFLWIATEEKGKVMQNLLGKIHTQLQEEIANAGNDDAKKKSATDKFNSMRMGITKKYGDEDYFFTPNKTLSGLKFAVDHLPRITATTAGAKLKKLAKIG